MERPARGLARAFTLIELLIVVAIIAILAAIAVPNFLEAQVRSKVTRAKADMRTLATALEAYVVDYNHYPPTGGPLTPSFLDRLRPLTTPVSYVAALPSDPFPRATTSWAGALVDGDPRDLFGYNLGKDFAGPGGGPSQEVRLLKEWSLTSAGPDGEITWPYYAFPENRIAAGTWPSFVYDPTNGTVSTGEIFRRGGASSKRVPGLDD